MTGKELIDTIKKLKGENSEVVISASDGEDVDTIDTVEWDHTDRIVIYIN